MLKKLKGDMMVMSHQVKNINEKIQILKRRANGKSGARKYNSQNLKFTEGSQQEAEWKKDSANL